MRSKIRQIAVILSLLVSSGSLHVVHAGTLPDSVKGIPQARFMQFWDTYMVSTLHYGDENVPNRVVGFFGEVDSIGSPVNVAMGFLETNRDIFRIHDVQSELILDTIKTETDGGRTIVLQQMCQGLKVAGCHFDFGITPESSMELITGRYLPDVEVSVKPQIDSLGAISIVRDSLAQSSSVPSSLQGSLCILPDHRMFRLVWEIERPLPADGTKRIQPIYVDAHSGAIVTNASW